MKQKLYHLSTIVLFCGLLIGMGFTQTHLKSMPQIIMFFFGIFTLASLSIKSSFISSIPFYVVLLVMFYINIYLLTHLIVDFIHPYQGWITNPNGTIDRRMNTNWIWGIFTSFILSPLAVIFYYKKIQRNKFLEMSFMSIFIILTAIIYIKDELLLM